MKTQRKHWQELNSEELRMVTGGNDLETFLKRVADAVRDYVYDKTGHCLYE